jgi:hypothetical protein
MGSIPASQPAIGECEYTNHSGKLDYGGYSNPWYAAAGSGLLTRQVFEVLFNRRVAEMA